MEQNKKKEWMKNVIIIFLVFMLLLTFFSKTITNATLSVVTTINPASEVIQDQARGTGSISSANPYSVMADESRTISSVAVENGSHVEIGDPLFYLEDKESTELQKAKKDLSDAQLKFDQQLFSSESSTETIMNARTGNYDSDAQLQAELYDVEKRLEQALVDYNNAKNEYDVQQVIKKLTDLNYNDLDAQTQKALLDAEVQKLKYEDVSEEKERELQIQAADAAAALLINQSYNTQKKAESSATAESYQVIMDNAKFQYDTIKTEQEELQKDIKSQITLKNYDTELELLQAEVDRLTALAYGATITAPVAGTVSEIKYQAGFDTETGKCLCTIIPDGVGFNLTISVDKQQAAKVKVGDFGELVNSFMYDDAVLKVSSILDDEDSKGTKKKIVFDVQGEGFTLDQSLEVSVGSKSARYDVCVPNNAIHSDNVGKYVYVVNGKKTPFAKKKYIVSKEYVNVTANDDNNSAVSGNVTNEDFIITSWDKPFKAGDEVRFKND